MSETIKNTFENMWGMLSMISFVDIVDIALLSVILYYIYKFIRDRRAGKLALGVLFMVVFLAMSEIFEMHAMQFIFKNVFQIGMITLIIVFQPELRSALEKVGGESLRGFKSIGEQKGMTQMVSAIDEVCEAAAELSKTKTGALMVFERSTKLGERILTGTIINADTSSFLIRNIFFNKAPLHDGAMILREGRIHAAGCLLPLSENPDIIKDLGTRHRAAIGMSENSDAAVVVVSEETGTISLAFEGKLKRGFNKESLKAELRSLLLDENAPTSIPGKIINRLHRSSSAAEDKTSDNEKRKSENNKTKGDK